MQFSALINKLIIFVVLMCIGYICAHRGFTDAKFTRTTSSLVMNVFMTGTILKSVWDMETAISLPELGRLLLTMSLVVAFGAVLGAVMTRILRIDREHAGLFELLSSMGNNMFIALPVVQAVLGPKAVFYVSLTCLPFNLILFTYGVLRLQGGHRESKFRLRDILNVPIVVTLIALLLFATQPPVPAVVRELANALSGATMPLSMFVIGSSLGGVSLLETFRTKQLYLASFIRLILAPVLVGLLGPYLIADPELLTTCIVVAGCPSAVFITVLSIQYGKDYVYSSEGVLQSTALSMVTIPLMLYLFS